MRLVVILQMALKNGIFTENFKKIKILQKLNEVNNKIKKKIFTQSDELPEWFPC